MSAIEPFTQVHAKGHIVRAAANGQDHIRRVWVPSCPMERERVSTSLHTKDLWNCINGCHCLFMASLLSRINDLLAPAQCDKSLSPTHH